MALEITPTHKGEKVTYKNPSPEFFQAIGGEEGMRDLMYTFYDLIYESDIHNFFPQDREEFDKVKEKIPNFSYSFAAAPKSTTTRAAVPI